MTIRNIKILTKKFNNCPYCGQGLHGTLTPDESPRDIIEPLEKGPVLVRRERELSVREQQVVNLIKQAKANKEIAYELQLTEGTIKEYLFTIFKKVGVKNRTELALWAAEKFGGGTISRQSYVASQ